MKPIYLDTLAARIQYHEHDGTRREKRGEIVRLKQKLRQAFSRANDPRLSAITKSSAASEARRLLSKLERIDPAFKSYITSHPKRAEEA